MPQQNAGIFENDGLRTRAEAKRADNDILPREDFLLAAVDDQRVAGTAPAGRPMLQEQMSQTIKDAIERWRARLRTLSEYLLFDSAPARGAMSAVMSILAAACYAAGKDRRGIGLAMSLHRGDYPGPVPKVVTEALAVMTTAAAAPAALPQRIRTVCLDHMENLAVTPQNQRFFKTPADLLNGLAMVVKSPTPTEKGVLLILYSYAIPLFGRLFDLKRVSERYHLVIEPSWSGYCNVDVLSYAYQNVPVFVQAYEPRDRAFIDGIPSLISVPLSNNWWVDHRVFKPLPSVEKDIDVIMVASWGVYKRHDRFFAALSALRRRGVRLRVALVGYALGLTLADVKASARAYGVGDQIEWYEHIPQDEINRLLNRSKVNVLWSRKEGVNRAIIEGMFAGVPCIVREGFNYGHHYAYINDKTGRYSSEADLPDMLLWMIENPHRFDPYPWVIEHMTCQRSTAIMEQTLRAHTNESWTTGLAVKTNDLYGMAYWDDADKARFADDYAFLRSAIRVEQPQA